MIKDKIDKTDEILFNMIKLALIKALAPISLMVLVLIIGLSPLYVTLGIMTRQFTDKANIKY